jgi:hypothetical protein
MYGIPFICFIIGLFGGYFGAEHFGFQPKEVIGFVIGIVFVVISYMWIRSKESYWKNKNYMPQAVRIADKPKQ